jgi:hypothetical protein
VEHVEVIIVGAGLSGIGGATAEYSSRKAALLTERSALLVITCGACRIDLVLSHLTQRGVRDCTTIGAFYKLAS